jgi:FtsH-binding integral membrane protein
MIYGGIAMYGGFTMSDTQKMLKKIEEDINKDQGKSYDPINESLGLTLDAIGIFVRLLMILAKQEEKNKYISSLVEKK